MEPPRPVRPCPAFYRRQWWEPSPPADVLQAGYALLALLGNSGEWARVEMRPAFATLGPGVVRNLCGQPVRLTSDVLSPCVGLLFRLTRGEGTCLHAAADPALLVRDAEERALWLVPVRNAFARLEGRRPNTSEGRWGEERRGRDV